VGNGVHCPELGTYFLETKGEEWEQTKSPAIDNDGSTTPLLSSCPANESAGAPHLARSSRDVGYQRVPLAILHRCRVHVIRELNRSVLKSHLDKIGVYLHKPTAGLYGAPWRFVIRRFSGGGSRLVYIASGTVMPSQSRQVTRARSATAAVASRNCLRAGSSSVRMWCRW
jgi:hypothetical protein